MRRTTTPNATSASLVLGHQSPVIAHALATFTTVISALALLAMLTITGCQQGTPMHRVHVVDVEGNPLAQTDLAVTFWQRRPTNIPPAHAQTGRKGTVLFQTRPHAARTLFITREGYGNFAIPYHLLPEQTDVTVTMRPNGFKPIVAGIDEADILVINVPTWKLPAEGVSVRSIIVSFDDSIPKYVKAESSPYFAGYAMQHNESTNKQAIDPAIAATIRSSTTIDPNDAVAATPLQPSILADGPIYELPQSPNQVITGVQTATVPTDAPATVDWE